MTGDVNFDSNTLFVDVSADKVGIGTNLTSRSLEISQAIPAIRFVDTDSATGYMELKGAKYAFEFTLDSDDALSSSAMSFKVDNTEYIKLRDNRIEILDGSATFNSAVTNIGDVQTGLFFSVNGTMAFSSAGTSQFTMADGVIAPVTFSDVDLGTTSLRFKNAYIDLSNVTGNVTGD